MKTIYKILFSISFMLLSIVITHAQTPTWISSGSGSGSYVYLSPISARLGIGTTVPSSSYILDVKGMASVSSLAIQGWGTETGAALTLYNSLKTGAGRANHWKIYNMGAGPNYSNSLQFWAYDANGPMSGGSRLTLADNGNVGIGTQYPGAKLDVIGIIRAEEVKVCLNQGCDFVFEEDYNLMNINDLSNFIKTNKHLPDVAPAAIMEDEGINVSEMSALLLRKIEELTLYVIDLKNENEVLKQEVDILKNK